MCSNIQLQFQYVIISSHLICNFWSSPVNGDKTYVEINLSFIFNIFVNFILFWENLVKVETRGITRILLRGHKNGKNLTLF